MAAAGLSLLNVSGCWERVVVGAVVLIAVLTDLLRSRDSSSRSLRWMANGGDAR